MEKKLATREMIIIFKWLKGYLGEDEEKEKLTMW